MSADDEKLLLLDGHSLAYRAFYALPVENFSTSTGQPTNAVYGFTSMLINALRDEQPTHLAVAFDLSRQSFRTQEFPAYKATRSESPSGFSGQVSLIQEVLNALCIPFVTAEGFEADDVIATLTSSAESHEMSVAIITGDRDAFQLVSDRVTVLYPKRGVSEMTRFTPAELNAKYGLTPAQYADYAALRGDPSDNLPSVPGVGEKTAAKWILEYGSLAALVDRADEVKGKVGDSLREHLGSVVLNRRLTELVRDVQLTVELDDLRVATWDRDEVAKVFDTLQFRVLRERLYATVSSPEAESDRGFEQEVDLLASGGLGRWLATHAGPEQTVGIAVHGRWGRGTGEIVALALATADGAGTWIDPTELEPTDEQALAGFLANPAIGKVMHDAKGPILALLAHGWALAGLTCDTALAAYLALPGQRSFDLSDLTLRFLGRELRSEGPASDQLSFDGSAEAEAAETLAIQARATLELAGSLDQQLEQQGGRALLLDVEMPLVAVLADMERVGIAADQEHLADLHAHFFGEVRQAASSSHAVVGREFNLGSPKQLQAILFDELDLPKTKRIKTGYTTDAEALQGLLSQTGHPLLEHLLHHRDMSKLLVTVEGLQRSVSEDGRIHTTYSQTVASTGRLSSTDPNLQNVPIRTAEGRRIRQAFIVGPEFETLLTADYSQVEMRIMAHLSKDEALIEAFASGEDLHTTMASRVFGVPVTEVTPELRGRIKAMSYGLAYGLSSYGLSQQLAVSPEDARGLMDEYFERFGGVRDYLRGVVDEARRTGFTETLLGRRRYLPDLTSDNRQRREMAERMALNAPIQGSAADIIKVAMLGVHSALHEEGLASRLLLQVHDELVLEVAAGELARVEVLVREQMGMAYPLTPVLELSVGFGRDWDSAAH